MDVKPAWEKAASFLKKYRYVAIVLLVGLVLMLLPSKKKDAVQLETAVTGEWKGSESIDTALSNILSKVSGAGCVEVLLTSSAGEETIYQTNENRTDQTDSSGSYHIDTVTLTDAQRNQTGLVRQVNPPIYKGAIVVCEGADDPTVVLAVVDAVSKVTGLSSNRISVLKMK